MALPATIRRFEIALADADREVYEQLDLRVAQHPSEPVRRVLLKTIAYALVNADGISVLEWRPPAHTASVTIPGPSG